MLRQYSKTLLLIAVASLLFLGDFAVELLAPDLAKPFEQDARLKLLLWGLLSFCLAATVFLFVKEHNAPASEVGANAGPVFATEVERANRRALLGLVRRTWIEGVLHKSLWNEVRLILNLEARPDAVVRPCDLALRRAGQPDTYIRPGTSILEVYRQEQEEMLLLGEPGSGKTTLLLEIAQSLLQEAARDETLPVPVVFNLSTWRKGHMRLDAWLVEQLNRDYGIPERVARRWVEGGALLLLLDGLDEVAVERRAECVGAINAYRLKHQSVLRPMVVCCRTREYEEIPALRLSSAVVIRPLTRRQVDGYLKDGGRALAGLRAVLMDEPALYRELFETPLMLHVAVMTYEGQSAAALRRGVKPEERRRRLWDAYIERMFERKQEAKPLYQKAKALDWLAWMGDYLTRRHIQKYLIEWTQPDDLPRRWQTLLVRWLLSPVLVVYFFMSVQDAGYAVRVALVLFGIWLGHSRHIGVSPVRHYTLGNLRSRWKSILLWLTFGALAGAAFGATIFAVARGELAVSLSASMMFGTVVGVLAAIPGKLILIEVISLDSTVRPNQQQHLSLRTGAFAAGIIVAVLGIQNIVIFGMPDGVAPAVGPAVFVGVYAGWRWVFQHYLLRLLLWWSGQFPLNITPFLDWAAQRVLLQRVGGGWRFVHRTLQERFAERYAEKYPGRRRSSPLSVNVATPALSRDEP